MKTKKTLPLLCFISLNFGLWTLNSFAQFPFSIGSITYDRGYHITADANNNVYVTGSFTGTADFDPSALTANLTSTGSDDIFVAKYNSSGAVCLQDKVHHFGIKS